MRSSNVCAQVRCGNADVEDLVKATAPYQKKRFVARKYGPVEVNSGRVLLEGGGVCSSSDFDPICCVIDVMCFKHNFWNLSRPADYFI